MKKVLMLLIIIMGMFALTGCDNQDSNKKTSEDNNIVTTQKVEEDLNNKKEEQKQEDVVINDNGIVDFDDEDNVPDTEGTVVVEKIINCNNCVFAYFSEEKSFGSTLSEGEYTTDINNLKTAGGKQRHNFFGLVLSDNKITKAHACILKDNKIYCIEGSVDGTYHTANIGILNQIFTADQCKYISAGHTYVCTDGNYNGDTITTGYTSMHYETSCTIYGSDARTGTMICH